MECDVLDIFEFSDGSGGDSGDKCSATDLLRYTYIGGLALIGLLLLLVTIMLVTLCCLASKLRKNKRYCYLHVAR